MRHFLRFFIPGDLDLRLFQLKIGISFTETIYTSFAFSTFLFLFELRARTEQTDRQTDRQTDGQEE